MDIIRDVFLTKAIEAAIIIQTTTVSITVIATALTTSFISRGIFAAVLMTGSYCAGNPLSKHKEVRIFVCITSDFIACAINATAIAAIFNLSIHAAICLGSAAFVAATIINLCTSFDFL